MFSVHHEFVLVECYSEYCEWWPSI